MYRFKPMALIDLCIPATQCFLQVCQVFNIIYYMICEIVIHLSLSWGISIQYFEMIKQAYKPRNNAVVCVLMSFSLKAEAWYFPLEWAVTGCSVQLSPLICCLPERNASSCVSFCLPLLWYLNRVLPPRDAKDEPLRPSHHHSQGAAGGEPQPLLERPEPRRSGGVVRFALDGNQTE